MGWFKKIKRKAKKIAKKVVSPIAKVALSIPKVVAAAPKAVVKEVSPIAKTVLKIPTTIAKTAAKIPGTIVDVAEDVGKAVASVVSPKVPKASAARTGAPKQQDEELQTDIQTAGIVKKRRQRGKRALIAQKAAANVGGSGKSGLNIPIG